MADGGWRIADGRWLMADGRCRGEAFANQKQKPGVMAANASPVWPQPRTTTNLEKNESDKNSFDSQFAVVFPWPPL
jgi:hypothetical protein